MGQGLPNMLESKGLVGNIMIINDFVAIIHRMTPPFSFLFTTNPLEYTGLIKNIQIFKKSLPLIHKTFGLFFSCIHTEFIHRVCPRIQEQKVMS
jgi:hypothetical protein